MGRSRTEIILSMLKGLLAAVALTLLGMAGIAALAVYARASDGLIRGLNQALKCLAILTGTLTAVGRGGERGFFTGMALAIVYMALGYGLAVKLGGNAFAAPGMLGEILIGAALGGVAGAVLSNLPAKRRRAAA
ncbi:MAG: TIGR04086 family membrane protein [Clostridia bacterium]|nr:TIGR04086 family membrane protein [Clostridia bacterium]